MKTDPELWQVFDAAANRIELGLETPQFGYIGRAYTDKSQAEARLVWLQTNFPGLAQYCRLITYFERIKLVQDKEQANRPV